MELINKQELTEVLSAALPEVLSSIPAMTQKGRESILQCVTDAIAQVEPRGGLVSTSVGNVNIHTWNNALDVAKCLHIAMVDEGVNTLQLSDNETKLDIVVTSAIDKLITVNTEFTE